MQYKKMIINLHKVQHSTNHQHYQFGKEESNQNHTSSLSFQMIIYHTTVV